MARQLRVQFKGAIYHVTARGNAQTDIYLDDQDRRFFLSSLERCAEAYSARICLYCLMLNHFHLVVETPRANLGRFMHSLLTGYTVYFNQRHKRHGHLTQGRYGAKLVEGNAYVLKLSRYVHLNPVKVKGVVELPEEERLQCLRAYVWSSYLSYIGQRPRQKWVEYGPVECLAGGSGQDSMLRYRQFVEGGIAADDEEFLGDLVRSSLSIGGDKFREYVDCLYDELVKEREKPEDVQFRRIDGQATPEAVVSAVCRVAGLRSEELQKRRRDCIWRGVAAGLLCKRAGLTRRACAELLGLRSGAAVSYHVLKVENKTTSDKRLVSQIAKIEKRIKKTS
jgi:REP element-mobilizing transposase RayT